MNLDKWRKKNCNIIKPYAHFDKRVSLEQVWDYITDPHKVVKHSFYPFIHYEKKLFKP